ncbi:hypothetical protein KQX54_017407 [Cotesia glomerata]|uniref:Uncharacterized protein n=1 Tax=Cotesia glomerata TaxID=32391 RepID=A0AAV7HSY1_COTGL|nr:hypothetical protein KQX54_017407 [Cotesia glomerata]
MLVENFLLFPSPFLSVGSVCGTFNQSEAIDSTGYYWGFPVGLVFFPIRRILSIEIMNSPKQDFIITLRPGPRRTSSGRANPGRLSPSLSNVGRKAALGAPIPNMAPVQPRRSEAQVWPNSELYVTSVFLRRHAPSTPAWSRSRTPKISFRL